jgi:putative hemolysin
MSGDVIEILIILGLILLNGVFSMSEMALVSSKKVRLEAAAKSGAKGGKAALGLYLSPTYFLSTVQIGITLIGLLTGIFSGENLTNDLEAYLNTFPLVQPIADELAIAIVLLSVTFCSLVLGELIPKRLGLANPEGIARFMAPFMKILSKFTFPFVWVLTHTSDAILTILNLKKTNENNITEEEIKAIIQEGAQGGEIQKIEQDIVERVFALGDRKVSSLMTNRSNLTFLNVYDDFGKIRDTINKDMHRIYPVFENDKDKILGVVFLKDMFVAVQGDTFSLRDFVKPAYYLAENTPAYKALEHFKTSKVHFALVSNEYGIVLGIVTMDDILKALIGEVSEFYTPEDDKIIQRDDGSWLVDGEYPLPEFAILFQIENLKGLENVNTVAGLMLHQLNHIPKLAEKIKWKGLEIEVVDMDNVKIDKMMVRRIG